MTKYFVDASGTYIGGFDGAEPPEGAIEVPEAPQDARQTWDGSAWSAAPAPEPSPQDRIAELEARLAALEAAKP